MCSNGIVAFFLSPYISKNNAEIFMYKMTLYLAFASK